jgi:hypothetical protein
MPASILHQAIWYGVIYIMENPDNWEGRRVVRHVDDRRTSILIIEYMPAQNSAGVCDKYGWRFQIYGPPANNESATQDDQLSRLLTEVFVHTYTSGQGDARCIAFISDLPNVGCLELCEGMSVALVNSEVTKWVNSFDPYLPTTLDKALKMTALIKYLIEEAYPDQGDSLIQILANSEGN